jgi:hypothetical protein
MVALFRLTTVKRTKSAAGFSRRKLPNDSRTGGHNGRRYGMCAFIHSIKKQKDR